MAKNARHESLKSEMNAKRDESEAQIGKIEQAFEILGLKAQTIKCAAMDGLLEEANEHMDEYVKGAGRDAAIVISAQKVEHYGIASYGTLRTFAQNLGQKEISAIFQEIVNQKGAADKKLTQLAKTINTEALKAHKEGKA
jgi:ferritin-like metal-binding protein YciE